MDYSEISNIVKSCVDKNQIVEDKLNEMFEEIGAGKQQIEIDEKYNYLVFIPPQDTYNVEKAIIGLRKVFDEIGFNSKMFFMTIPGSTEIKVFKFRGKE